MPGPGKKFKKGNQVAKGNKGGGRNPDWFNRAMAEIAGHKDSIKFLKDMVNGKVKDFEVHGDDGQLIEVPVKAIHRLKAWCESADRGIGKAIETIRHANADGTNLVMQVPFRDQGQAGQVK